MLRILLCLLLATPILAQSNPQNWFTSLEEAKTYAQKKDVNILMVFAGSDWCLPCIKFKKDILQSSAFEAYSQNELAILYLDFPAKRKNKLSPAQTQHNEVLADRYNRSGAFPKLVLLNPQEEKLLEPRFKNQNASTFIEQLSEGISHPK